MKKGIFILSAFVMFGCTEPTEFWSATINNESAIARKEVVTFDISKLEIPEGQSLAVSNQNNQMLNAEILDQNADGDFDILRVLVEIPAKASVNLRGTLTAESSTTKMTQAEISVKEGGNWNGRKYEGGTFVNKTSVTVPESHTDHSYWIRYEGPGWESDLVGYRFYLDWRNGIDIFGKQTSEMVLQNVGQDGFESYHHLADWGLDVLKVGKSLGMGSIGRFQNDSLYRFQSVEGLTAEITENANLKSTVTTTYTNWVTEEDTVSLVSEISIEAASRVSDHHITFDQPLSGFCTGLVVSKNESYIQLEKGAYTLLATYGDFSLNNDDLGMAVIARTEDIEEIIEADHSHVIVFKPAQTVDYSFLAAWSGEKEGIKSQAEFEQYLDELLVSYNEPLTY